MVASNVLRNPGSARGLSPRVVAACLFFGSPKRFARAARAALRPLLAAGLPLIFVFVLAGCATVPARPRSASSSVGGEDKGDLFALPEAAQRARPMNANQNDGSLFSPQAAFWSPWRDDTAHAVGDIMTVRISIDNSAEKSASTELNRQSTLDSGITSLLGYESKIPGVGSSGTNSATTPAQLIKTESSSKFSGDGDTKRAGKMVADISALVTYVYPNGNMVIHGSQSLLINNETSLLTVDGIVRSSDISVDNVVSSDRIANAHVEITGRGVISDKQRPGLLMRVFDWVWPF